MAGTIIEFVKSRTSTAAGAATKHDRLYKVFGTSDDNEALTLLIGAAPTNVTIGGVLLSDVEYEVQEADHQVFDCPVNYKKREKKEPGDPPRYAFEINGETQHITHSLETVQAVGTGVNVDTYQRAIGFDGETIQGTDIFIPVYNFSETHVFATGFVTGAYKAALFRACGKTNQGSFRGFAPGEVLFLGASGTQTEDDFWEIAYRFAASENITGLAVGPLTGINKKGWEYLWVRFEDSIGSSKLVKRPSAAFVEKVYRPHDFANIGIGTA